MIGMLAETHIHTGCGRETGLVDLPVARESTTGYPVIFGSSLKGSFRACLEDEEKANQYFGEHDNAGNIIVSDARLLLLPVRSLSGHYKWITNPYILEMLKRDVKRSGMEVEFDIPEDIESGKAICGRTTDNTQLVLEEREFKVEVQELNGIIELLQQFIPHEDTRKRLAQQLVVLNKEDFQWFAKYGLAVHARNVLKENKTSDNLWYEESLAPDTLLYTIVFDRKNSLEEFIDFLNEECSYLQVGGNETIGQGWFSLKLIDGW